MAANAITKISARAKQIRRKSPGKSWKACIKEASRDYNGGKLGAAKKKVSKRVKNRQTGKSNRKRDQLFKAKAPGKRRTRHGTTYTERRANRSDKPGQMTGAKLTGTAYNEMILRRLQENNTALAAAESRLTALKNQLKTCEKPYKIVCRKNIKEQQKYIGTIKHTIRMLRVLVK